jgi:hypothetical protein
VHGNRIRRSSESEEPQIDALPVGCNIRYHTSFFSTCDTVKSGLGRLEKRFYEVSSSDWMKSFFSNLTQEFGPFLIVFQCFVAFVGPTKHTSLFAVQSHQCLTKLMGVSLLAKPLKAV